MPVPCKIKEVKKPLMPVDGLTVLDSLFTKVKDMAAELERRIAYETELEAAVKECQ